MSSKLMRSADGELIRIALITGHTILIGAEPVEVPAIFQIEARKSGAVFAKEGDLPATPGEGEKPNATTQETDQIKAALVLMLEREEDGDFTTAGQPNLRAVRELCGFNAERDDIYNVFAALKEEIASNGGKVTTDLS
ncbi:MAG: hypothetical protein ACRC2H_00945 [Silanimonas sp.]